MYKSHTMFFYALSLCLLGNFVQSNLAHGEVMKKESVLSQSDNPFLGTWKTEAEDEEKKRWAHVKVAPCGGDSNLLCGKIVLLNVENDPDTGQPRTDKNNEDETLQSRPLLGVEVLSNFQKDSDLKYTSGTIYNTRDGETYSGELSMNPDNLDELEVTGSVLFISSTKTWKRVD